MQRGQTSSGGRQAAEADMQRRHVAAETCSSGGIYAAEIACCKTVANRCELVEWERISLHVVPEKGSAIPWQPFLLRA